MSDSACVTAQNFCQTCQTGAETVGYTLTKGLPDTQDYITSELGPAIRAALQKLHDYGKKGSREWPSQNEINSIPNINKSAGQKITAEEYNKILKIISVTPITVSETTQTVHVPGELEQYSCYNLCPDIFSALPDWTANVVLTEEMLWGKDYTYTTKKQKKSEPQYQVDTGDVVSINVIKQFLRDYQIDYNRCNDCNTSNNCAQCHCDCHRSSCDTSSSSGCSECCMYGGSNAGAGCHTHSSCSDYSW